MRSGSEITSAVEKYADMVRKISLCHLKNEDEAEDIFQDVFLKYMLCEKEFESEEHEKAWIIRVTINKCRDSFRNHFKKNTISIDTLINETASGSDMDTRDVISAVLHLPAKYRDVVYLHYYEGYTAAEIGQILSKKENTVYSLISRAKGLLKTELEDE